MASIYRKPNSRRRCPVPTGCPLDMMPETTDFGGVGGVEAQALLQDLEHAGGRAVARLAGGAG